MQAWKCAKDPGVIDRFLRPLAVWLSLTLTLGCAGVPLSASELNSVARPAFVSRLELDAGPRSSVFRDLPSLQPRLRGLAPAEADRRLVGKLNAVSRFELSERLRVGVTRRLPNESPWSHAVPQVQVASVLQSFLTEEVPARSPDTRQLESLGADTLVELVIESYGMKGKGGKPVVFLSGRGRMAKLGGSSLWYRSFSFETEGAEDALDPLRVAQDPQLFRDALAGLLDRAAEQLAKELQPARTAPRARSSERAPSLDDPQDGNQTADQPRADPVLELPPGELPPP